MTDTIYVTRDRKIQDDFFRDFMDALGGIAGAGSGWPQVFLTVVSMPTARVQVSPGAGSICVSAAFSDVLAKRVLDILPDEDVQSIDDAYAELKRLRGAITDVEQHIRRLEEEAEAARGWLPLPDDVGWWVEREDVGDVCSYTYRAVEVASIVGGVTLYVVGNKNRHHLEDPDDNFKYKRLDLDKMFENERPVP